MFIDGLRVWKGRDNYKPCRDIYKGLYMIRPAWYVKNHLDNLRADVMAIIDAFYITIDDNEKSRKDCWDKITKETKNKNEIEKTRENDEQKKHKDIELIHKGSTCFQLEKLQNNSITISIFSCIEGYLWQVCREMEICLETKVKLKHISKNDYLKNYLDYLENVADINCQKIKSIFNNISSKKFIRNRIIHNSNTVIDAIERKKLEGIKGIRFHQGHYDDLHFYIEKEFLLNLLDVTKNLFETIFGEIEKRIYSGIYIEHHPNNVIITPVPREKK